MNKGCRGCLRFFLLASFFVWLTVVVIIGLIVLLVNNKDGIVSVVKGVDKMIVSPTLEAKTTAIAWSCPNAPVTRLNVGETVKVSNTNNSTRNILRNGAGKSYKALASMPAGTTMKIVGGPQCASNYVYWQVLTDEFGSGWTAEGDKSAYWLDLISDQR